MTDQPARPPDYWRRNLVVCAAGSFTTLVGMTMLVPYLPVFVGQLGITDPDDVLRWSGIAYGATFLTAGLTAPLWGRLGDRFGRRSMLIRASLGMAVAMSLIGLAQNVWQLVALRLLTGLLGGYSSASTILVAAQAPKERTSWALGVLSSGVLAGSIAGPLIGGVVPLWIGARATFLFAGGLIFLAFLATVIWVKEAPRPAPDPATAHDPPEALPHRGLIVLLLVTGGLLMFATMSVEPIITVFVGQLTTEISASAGAGVVMAVGAAGTIVSAPRIGAFADRIGHLRVVTGCLFAAAVLVLAQAASQQFWQLLVLRLATGVALAGLMPCLTAAIRHLVPAGVIGRVLGLGVAAQYAGHVLGPVTGGVVGAQAGLRSVFVMTAAVLAIAGAGTLVAVRLGHRRARFGDEPTHLTTAGVTPGSRRPETLSPPGGFRRR